MTAEKVQPLTSMTNAELRQYLLYDDHFDHMSFIQITAEYMQKIIETEATSTKDNAETMNSETKVQDGFTKMTKELNDEVVKEIDQEEAMQSSGMPDWLCDTVDVLQIAMACMTFDPVAVGLACVNCAMTFKVNSQSLMTKIEDATVGDDPTKRAEFELGFAAGEATLCGIASVGGDMEAADATEEAAANGAEVGAAAAANAAKSGLTRLADLGKYFMTYLFQGLMLDNFWPDFFQGPCKMSPENAMLAGMFVGMATGIGADMAAAAKPNGLATMLGNKFASLSVSAQQVLRAVFVALTVISSGFQLATGVENIKAAQQLLKLADFIRDVVAGSMSKLSLVKSLTNGMNSMITLTTDTVHILSDDASTMNQTFSSYAEMFREAQ